ncbi:hypothetical protein TD95_002232 [Thielaviopsis punctulata]|uniref:Uncharacterized protein n=1 Tax=Thielaviopsis punctulata TaxID=72032 RepID=A0A0F4ZDF3_9PEZI|nr:hypothetical protein TD95_002232 [Thielaviopsis punctulata]
MAEQMPRPSSNTRRVKLYELHGNDWFDKGIGFCNAGYSQVFLNLQTEDGQEGEPQVMVHAEENPDRFLLFSTITKEDGFQKQQVWTDPQTGIDMALSFEEAETCANIWRFISSVQASFHTDDSLDDDLPMEYEPSPVALPPADIGKLYEIDQAIRVLSSQPVNREALCKYITSDNYIPGLISVFNDAEDLESINDLYLLCGIMKQIILLNDTSIIEQIVTTECIDGVIGALEYDPDYPGQKANHRQWLNGKGRFREVVKIADQRIEAKIHQTYRLQYLKDVVLARILDDTTFSVLNSLIFFNQVEIVQHIQGNSDILNDLFSVFNPSSALATRRRDAVIFIQQCCSIAKNLEAPTRVSLYNNFIAHGLFNVVHYGLRHQDVSIRVGATEIMVSMIDHDPQMVRNTMYRQISENQPTLVDSLIDLLLVETDPGIKTQISDAIKVLLDTVVQNPAPTYAHIMRMNPEAINQYKRQSEPHPQQEEFIKLFYSSSAERLFKPLIDIDKRDNMDFSLNEAALFTYLIDILIFFLRQHNLSKVFVFQQDFCIRLTRLFEARQKHLKLIPVRLVRHMIAMRQEVCLKHLIARDAFMPIFNLLRKTLPRSNLVSSACFDVFDYVNREKVHPIAKHLVEDHRDILEADDLKSYCAFQLMCKNYDASQAFNLALPPTEYDNIMNTLFRARASPEVSASNESADPEPIANEEDYWNVPEGDVDAENDIAHTPRSRSSSILSNKLLVDYHSDEDSDENAETDNTCSPEPEPQPQNEPEPNHDTEPTASDSTTPPPSTPPAQTATPPERTSEKRRRNEDEDDDLFTSVTKRRLSVSSTGSPSGGGMSNMLRRKKSFASTSPSSSKIAMNVAQSPVTTGSGGSDTE